MRATENPFVEIKREHRRRMPLFLSRVAFNSSTFRIFNKGASDKIRVFFATTVGCGERLGKIADFNKYHASLIRRFPSSIRLSGRRKKPKFGHKAKVIDLYFKTLCLQREALNESAATKLQRKLHVPLDKIVLECVWQDFKDHLTKKRLQKGDLKLSRLTRKNYRFIQRLLARSARSAKVPAIWYDDNFLTGQTKGRRSL